MNPTLQIFLIVISSIATLCSGLVLWNFRELSERITKVETDHKDFLLRFANCKQDCDRCFVDKEDFLREAGFSRDKLDQMSNTLSRLEGKLQVTEKLPDICGRIAGEIAAQFKTKG